MKKEIQHIVAAALHEDHSKQDITTNTLVRRNQISSATIVVKENCVLCGTELVAAVFRKLDHRMHIHFHHRDGEKVAKNTAVVSLKGYTRALLSGERTALNFVSYLSGIATLTNQFVRAVDGCQTKIMDTRKTMPGMRLLVKMAVRCGGGVNHRFNLKEMVMIKDNHIIAYESEASIPEAIRHVRRRTKKMLVVEVDTFAQFQQALEAKPDVIMLDNMDVAQMKKAVEINIASGKPCLLEASGGVTLDNVHRIAELGIDRISIGALTHSPRAIDFSMEFEFNPKQ
jgi:nicotinate-nucleotide pyrophosphorylase (carboxylating)